MSIEPKVFSVTLSPLSIGPATYCTAYPSKLENIRESLWKPEGMDEFGNDYCFSMHLKEGQTLLSSNPEFQQTADKIRQQEKRHFSNIIERVPATLLIGKKPGDSLYFRDGTEVRLARFERFELLHKQIAASRAQKDDPDFNPHSRLDEISQQLNAWLKPEGVEDKKNNAPAKVFEAMIFPKRGAEATLFSKDDSVYYPISEIVWQSEDTHEFEDEICFRVCLTQPPSLDKRLTSHPDFKKILGNIGDCTHYDWIPARLLIGKKTGDYLTLKDGTKIKLTCGDFRFLENQLQFTRVNYPEYTDRLNDLSAQVKSVYGELTEQVKEEGDTVLVDLKQSSEPSCLQKCVSAIKCLFRGIAQFFVRLFTWNWSEKTCLDGVL